MIRWMCGISLKDRRTNEELRRLVGVVPITTFIRSGRLRWYGHVMRKGDEDWVKKCMEYRVEGRRNTHTPHTRAPTAPRLTIQTENTTSITSPTQTHNIFQHSKAKKTLFLTTAATQQTFPQTPTQSLQQT